MTEPLKKPITVLDVLIENRLGSPVDGYVFYDDATGLLYLVLLRPGEPKPALGSLNRPNLKDGSVNGGRFRLTIQKPN
jgi:hypothetical protein